MFVKEQKGENVLGYLAVTILCVFRRFRQSSLVMILILIDNI